MFDESREIKLIELGNNGFNKVVRIRVENIAGCLNIIYKCFVKCEVIYE